MVLAWDMPALGYAPYPASVDLVRQSAESVLTDAVQAVHDLAPELDVEGRLAHGSAARVVLDESASAALLAGCGIGAPDYPEFGQTSYRIEGMTADANGGAATQTVIYRDGPKMRVEAVLPNYGQATIVFDESTNAAYVLNPTAAPTAAVVTPTPGSAPGAPAAIPATPPSAATPSATPSTAPVAPGPLTSTPAPRKFWKIEFNTENPALATV